MHKKGGLMTEHLGTILIVLALLLLVLFYMLYPWAKKSIAALG